MAGFRTYCDLYSQENKSQTKIGGILELSQDESRHLCGSLRAVQADKVDVFNLEDKVYSCEIFSASHKKTLLKVLDIIEITSIIPQIYLAQALPKGKTFDDIIRQSVEVGAAGIFPIVSDRTQVRFESQADAQKKRAKWRIQLIEAIKQSANFMKFDLNLPINFKNFIKDTDCFDLKIIASLRNNSMPIFDLLSKSEINPKKVCILIGPEGDFSEDEYNLAEDAGFKSVTLGKNVMKSETAALCALSCVCNYFIK